MIRAEGARLARKRQSEALAAATAEYRRLSPFATGDKLVVSGEVNRMIAAAINVIPNGSGTAWMRDTQPDPALVAARCGAETTVPDWRERLVCSQCGRGAGRYGGEQGQIARVKCARSPLLPPRPVHSSDP